MKLSTPLPDSDVVGYIPTALNIFVIYAFTLSIQPPGLSASSQYVIPISDTVNLLALKYI